MFDKSKPNVIILTDFTDVLGMSKMFGPYKVAYELRQAGFETMVLDHLHTMTLDEIKYLLKNLISDQTLFIGVNNVFYKDISGAVKKPGEPMYYKDAWNTGAFLPHGNQHNQELKSFVQNINPKIKFVSGGSAAIDSVWNKDFDYLIFGYADHSAVRLAQHLQNETIKTHSSYRSIYGPTVIDDAKAENFDFANSTMSYAPHDVILPDETLVIEISRGCIFKCTFCSYPLNGKKKLDYIKHEELLYNEFLENYNRFGVTRYTFSDDTFNDSIEKIDMIWRISQRLPFKLEYWAYIRLDLLGAHLDVTDKLFDSGLTGCYFGIETLNQKTAKTIGKGGSRERQIETLKYIKNKYGDQVMLSAGFILGLPYEDLSSMQLTIDMLLNKEIPLDSWSLYPLHIRADASRFSQTSHSDLDTNYEKYGYKPVGEEKGQMIWANEYTDWLTVRQLARDAEERGRQLGFNKVGTYQSFGLAGLGIGLDATRNKSVSEVNWFEIDQAKEKRAYEYKNKIYQIQGIAPLYDAPYFSWTSK